MKFTKFTPKLLSHVMSLTCCLLPSPSQCGSKTHQPLCSPATGPDSPQHISSIYLYSTISNWLPHARGERELIYYNMERGSESRKFMWFSSGVGAPGCSGAIYLGGSSSKSVTQEQQQATTKHSWAGFQSQTYSPNPPLTSSSLQIHMHKIIKNNSTSHNFMHGKIFNYIPPHAHWKKAILQFVFFVLAPLSNER